MFKPTDKRIIVFNSVQKNRINKNLRCNSVLHFHWTKEISSLLFLIKSYWKSDGTKNFHLKNESMCSPRLAEFNTSEKTASAFLEVRRRGEFSLHKRLQYSESLSNESSFGCLGPSKQVDHTKHFGYFTIHTSYFGVCIVLIFIFVALIVI